MHLLGTNILVPGSDALTKDQSDTIYLVNLHYLCDIWHHVLSHLYAVCTLLPGVQPSPYCMYKFFDFNDYDTNIVQGSNNPHFSDLKTFPVGMTADLDSYLKAKVGSYIPRTLMSIIQV